MSLKFYVDQILEKQQRSLSWLATEMGMTFTGFKLSLTNETLKYSDLKKMISILNIPITMLFETGSTVQSIKGSHNNQGSNSMILAEPAMEYKWENDLLKDQIEQLKDQLRDKERLIKILDNR